MISKINDLIKLSKLSINQLADYLQVEQVYLDKILREEIPLI